MTYQEALKKRARLAYTGLQKKAEGDEAQNKAWNKKVDEEEAGRQHYIAEKNGIVNRAKGEQAVRDIQDEKDRAAASAAYIANYQKALDNNLASGQAYSDKLKELAALTAVAPADYTDKMNQVVNRALGEEKSRQLTKQKEDNAAFNAQNDAMLAQAMRDQGIANIQGALSVPGIQRQQYLDSLEPRRQEIEQLANKNPQLLYPILNDLVNHGASADAIINALTQADVAKGMEFDSAHRKEVAAQKALENRNLGIGIGAGALGGLGAAGAAYGLAGLFPSLRKKRLLRALIALGVGGAAGAGIGIGTTKGLNSGAIQGAYGATKDYLGSVGRGLSGKA